MLWGMTEAVDVIVVGLGVGGEEVAGSLAAAGLRVVGIERRLVGGECPYWGCVPSKMMIRAANLLAEARRVHGMAGAAQVQPDWSVVARRIREEATASWDDAAAVARFVDKGGVFVRGSARLRGPREVEVDGRVFSARRALVLATGTAPVIPPIDGLAGTPLWTNHEAIEADRLPKSLLVLGGGAIGLELAQVFARFGVEVTVIEPSGRVLSMEEPEASALVAQVLAREGVTVRTSASATSARYDGVHFTLGLADGSELIGERLLVSAGRRARFDDLGLEAAGLDPGARSISVDDHLRAGDGIWAVGDITGHGAFTHIAFYQARIAVRDILGQDTVGADYRALPRVTFTDPEIGAVGLTERQARDAGIRVVTGVAPLSESTRGWIHKAGNDGFFKLVVDADRDTLVGATSAGPAGGEVLSMLALAVAQAIPVSELRRMIYAYPTFHRGIESALSNLP